MQVQTMIQDASLVNAAVFCAAAVGGQFLHAVKKWTEGYDWVRSNMRATIGAVLANALGIVGFVSTGALDEVTKIATVISLGLFMGFSADSAVNKGSRKVWDAEAKP